MGERSTSFGVFSLKYRDFDCKHVTKGEKMYWEKKALSNDDYVYKIYIPVYIYTGIYIPLYMYINIK